jgi:FkbM family methyltransferase
MKFLKNLFKKFFYLIGLDIRKRNTEINLSTFNSIYLKKIRRNPIIFDVGANQGQSIERFKKVFDDPIIHAFEPIEYEFNMLKKKYSDDKNVILNNFAIGEKNEQKDFYTTIKSSCSSFNKITPNTDWLKTRSEQFNTNPEKFTTKVSKVKVITLDHYCLEKKINLIDILKIDTQGYEDKVLEGAQQIMSNDIISAIESEIMFDNVYEKYLTFSDLEKFLIPNNFRLCGIDLSNNNLFFGILFYADVLYFNKKKFNLN